MTAPAEAVFPDIEVVVVLLLQDLVGGADHCDTETPSDLLDKLPFIRVRKVDGFRGKLADQPVCEIDTFALKRAVAQPLSEQVYERLMGRPRSPSPAIDTTFCNESPRELPWGDERIRRWSATYGFSLRRSRLLFLP